MPATPSNRLLRYRLDARHPPGDWPKGVPDGVRLSPFEPGLAAAIHALLELGYRDGQGSVPGFQAWLDGLTNDAEYTPQLCFVALDAEGVVAVLQGWTSGFIKDVVVHPRAQRRGLARALLLRAFEVYRERGEGWVDLRVMTDNLPACRLYESLGLKPVEERPPLAWR